MPNDPEALAFTFIVTAAGVLSFLVVLVLYLVHPARRGALAPAAASLALLAPVVGIGAASKHLAQTFSDMAASGGGAAALIAGCTRAQALMRLGNVAAIVTLVAAAGLGWLGYRARLPSAHSQPSTRRLVLLLALLLVPVVAVSAVHDYARVTNRIAVAVAEAPTAKPGEPSIVSPTLVSRMSRGVMLGGLGAPALLILLVALAVASALLGWKTGVPPSFTAAATGLLLVAAVLAAAGILFFDRPVPLPR
jgi:hypothetical protein